MSKEKEEKSKRTVGNGCNLAIEQMSANRFDREEEEDV